MTVIRTTIYLEDKDRRALSELQRRYGLATLSDAIRFSIRVVQGLAPQETALAQHLPARGQRRPRKPGKSEALIAQARQTSDTTRHRVTQIKAFLNQRHRHK